MFTADIQHLVEKKVKIHLIPIWDVLRIGFIKIILKKNVTKFLSKIIRCLGTLDSH